MEILRREMKLKGYTIERLASIIKRRPATIHCWLTGEFSPQAASVKLLKDIGFSDEASINPSKEV